MYCVLNTEMAWRELAEQKSNTDDVRQRFSHATRRAIKLALAIALLPTLGLSEARAEATEPASFDKQIAISDFIQPDGITYFDNIETAFDAIVDNCKVTVFAKTDGTPWQVNDALAVYQRANVVVEGFFAARPVIRGNANKVALIVRDSDNVIIRNLTIENGGDEQANGGTGGVMVRDARDILLKDCIFTANHFMGLNCFTSDGATTALCTDICVEDCVFEGTQYHTKNASASAGSGAFFYRCSGVTVRDSVSRNNATDGVVFNGTSHIRVKDCDVHHNGRQGLLAIRSLENFPVVDVEITGGIYHNNNASGIQLERGNHTPHLEGPTHLRVFQVELRDNNTYAHFDDEPGHGNGAEAGLWVDECVDVDVRECDVHGNESGIRVTGSEDVLIRFNLIHDNRGQHCANWGGAANPGNGAIVVGIADSPGTACHRVGVYHNTVVSNGMTGAQIDTLLSASGNDGSRHGGFFASSDSTQVFLFNNIIGDSIGAIPTNAHFAPAGNVQVNLLAPQISRLDSNIHFSPPHEKAYHVSNTAGYQGNWPNYSAFARQFFSFEISSDEVDTQSTPIFNDTVSFILADGSPAEQVAEPVSTATDSKTSHIIPVADADLFRDGDTVTIGGQEFSINTVDGDEIELNAQATVAPGTEIFMGSHIGATQQVAN